MLETSRSGHSIRDALIFAPIHFPTSEITLHLQVVNVGSSYPLAALVDELNNRGSAPDDSLILIDNGSNPESRAWVARATRGYRGTAKMVTLHANVGFFGGHNVGLNEYWNGIDPVALLNPDLGASLSIALDAMESHLVNCDGVVGVSLHEAHHGRIRGMGRYNRWTGRLRFPPIRGVVAPTTACVDPLTCPSGALLGVGPRLLATMEGSLPQLTFMYMEELFVSEIARSLGFPITILNDPVVAHLGGTRRRRSVRRSAALIDAHVKFERWLRQRQRDRMPRTGPIVRTLREFAGQRMRDWPSLLVGIKSGSAIGDLPDASP